MNPGEIWYLDTLLTEEELKLLSVTIARALAESRSRNDPEITDKLVKLGTQLITDSHPYHPEEEFEND